MVRPDVARPRTHDRFHPCRAQWKRRGSEARVPTVSARVEWLATAHSTWYRSHPVSTPVLFHPPDLSDDCFDAPVRARAKQFTTYRNRLANERQDLFVDHFCAR